LSSVLGLRHIYCHALATGFDFQFNVCPVTLRECCACACCCSVFVVQRLEELVNELEPELYPPEYIAEEVRTEMLFLTIKYRQTVLL
jgi:hypothetical protein